MMRVRLRLIGSMVVVTACASTNAELTKRADTIDVALRARQAELDALNIKVDDARADLKTEQCRAESARLDADVALERAQCLQRRAEFGACIAANEARRAKGTSWGCLLGLGAAVATGGAAAPMALAGCGAGAALSAGGVQCSNPTCTVEPAILRSQVLAHHQLSAWPECAR